MSRHALGCGGSLFTLGDAQTYRDYIGIRIDATTFSSQ
jgi:hypothetical protein